ncbi:MAG: hypothetical protein KGI66_02330, partial [Patescibacteria group bacterium]|nr:hypothetical protein [Patescibacteria group bacterium]
MKNQSSGADFYKASGVDLEAGDVFSKYSGDICRASYKNSPHVLITDWSKGHFRGPRGWEFTGLPAGRKNVGGADGIGTKTILVTAADMIDCEPREMRRVARNLLAMCAGDITRWGGLPLLFMDSLEVNKLGDLDSFSFMAYKAAMDGLGDCAKEQGYVIYSGETAEMSDCVSSEIRDACLAFNWTGTMIGVNHPEKLIDGSSLRPGLVVMALWDALRSNGASAIRKFFRDLFGKEWWLTRSDLAQKYMKEAAKPAVLYDRFLTELNGWHDPEWRPKIKAYAIAHLSGGGLKDKFAEPLLFPRGLGAVLDNLHEPPEVVKHCVVHAKMSDEKAYRTFNGGQGALVVIEQEDEQAFVKSADEYGLPSKNAGQIIKCGGEPYVQVIS